MEWCVGIDCGVVYVSGVDVVVYVSGISAVVCARLPFFDEEPIAVLPGQKLRVLHITHPQMAFASENSQGSRVGKPPFSVLPHFYLNTFRMCSSLSLQLSMRVLASLSPIFFSAAQLSFLPTIH